MRHLAILLLAFVLAFPWPSSADRVGDGAFTVATSAARTADFTSVRFDQSGFRGLYLFVSVTAHLVTPSVTVNLQVDNNGTWETVATSTTALTVSPTEAVYFVGPGTGTANGITEAFPIGLPRSFRIFMDHADADSITYDVQGLLTY